MLTTVWPQVVDALLTQLRATSGYRAPGDSKDGILVLDSVEIGLLNDPAPTHVVIGSPGDPEFPTSPGSSDQTYGPMATTRPKDETGVIECMAVAQSGEAILSSTTTVGTVKTVRDQAYAIVAAVEMICRSDPKLGGVPGLQWAFVSSQTPNQLLGKGITCQIPFRITYFARLS